MKVLKTKISLLCLLLATSIGIFTACSDDDNFSDAVPDYSQAIIQSFKIGDKYADINHTTGTITMTLPAGTSLSSLTPEIRLPETASVTPNSGSAIDFSAGPVTFEVRSTNGAKRNYVATVAAFGDPKILSFSIGDNAGIIDYTAGTINVSIGSQDGDITNLTPAFVIAEGTTVDIASGVAQNFSNPFVYTVTSNDGYTAKQFTVHVTQTAAPLITSFSINGTSGIIDNATGDIVLVLPPGANLSSLAPDITLPAGQTVSPSSGSAQNFSSGPVTYTVTNSEGLTKVYHVTVQSVQQDKVAFIAHAATISSISEPDTKAAALWAETEYGADFKYITVDDLSPLALADVKVIFFYYDNTDSSDMPGGALTGSQVNILGDFVKAGGNMFIAGLANTYIDNMGRIPYNPTTIGTGAGTTNNEYWGLNNSVGKPTNVTGHPLFTNITPTNVRNTAGETFSWTFIPLLDDGYKEDHNAVWDLGGIPDLTLPHCSTPRGAEFEALTHCTILADWQFIPDMCVVVAAEWHPFGVWQGKIISVGAASYEWEINDGGNNQFDNNVKQLTRNAINYLLD
ncbi:DUF4960 domain-containing protein [Flavobacterium sp. Sd200]|uniref:DUF4960 domain-containing protein n=1 Tax=Flavobacterium sp. Sd200 TaxID=2692211 RepID=UPI0013693771|nr:DUF4960 domain-containing protein [Flavobacterium sp. Sd200]MXN91670.1 DUF4960 domain-containing protein [Flavobacterium sp. Sd200]